jgi:spore coat protein H
VSRSSPDRRLLPALLLLLLVACDPSGQVGGGSVDDDDSFDADVPTLRLNEFMAGNSQTIQDGTGSWADWVELYNTTEQEIDLEGWTLSDQIDDPEAGQLLGSLSIEAGGYLLLWADGDAPEGPDHLGFRLQVEGEELALFDPDEELVDALTYGRQANDVATARSADGTGSWRLVPGGTPGASNGAQQEWTGSPAAWPGPGPACDLVATDLEAPWFSEADLVEFTVGCSGELPTEQARIELLVQPTGASFEPDSSTLSWATGPASGGRADLVFQVDSDDGQVPHAGTVTVWVADDPSQPDNQPVDPSTYTEEWGLPVVHVQPQGLLDQEYVGADLWFDGQHYEAGIKIRGAASAGYPKNSYTLRFDGPELVVRRWDVTRDRLVLITTFDDNSYVRQKLIYDQWLAMADYWGQSRLTPRTFFAVLYLDGQYRGLYTAIDHPDDEFVGQMGFGDDGNLYKSVNHDANFGPDLANGSPKTSLHAGYEKKEGEPPGDFSDLDALVGFTSLATPQQLVDGADEWLDLREFMDWFLLVHYSASGDSAGKNCYLYNDPGGSGFRYTPWDFNHSWGQNWRTYRVGADDLNDYTWHNRVFASIQAVPETDAELWQRFEQMREDGPFSEQWIEDRVDGYYDQIQPSAERDWAMWANAYYIYGGWAGARDQAGDWTDYEGEKAYLYAWLEARAELFRVNHPQ